MKAIYVRPEISISVIEPSEMLTGSILQINGEIGDGGVADGRRRDETSEDEYWIEDKTVFGSLW
jgi:hypothetical protein